MWDHPTLDALVAVIAEELRTRGWPPAPTQARPARGHAVHNNKRSSSEENLGRCPVSEHGSVRLPVSAAQMGVWVAQQLSPDSPLYNCATCFEISGRLDAELLTEAVRRTVAETEALRVRFADDGDELSQIVAPAGDDIPVPDAGRPC
ncbi:MULTISPECIES: condensation domain-containing protein [unclassified Streptomyces]|uniref:condensation domain-containing protein n=1 Tax=unclassified Streptomyces TaxID=2593676 RepID=UPI0037F45C9E